MSIRIAKIEDWEVIKDLNTQLFEYEHERFDDSLNLNWPEEHESYYKNVITKDNYCTFVYSDNDKIVAYVVICFYDRPNYRASARKAEIENIFISEKFRGQGIGSELLKAAEEWAKSKNAFEVSVTASAGNKNALAFYRSLSYSDYDITLEKKL